MAILLTVGVLSTATVPAVLAGEVVTTPGGSTERRAAVHACMRMTAVLAAGCALVAGAAVVPYAGPGTLGATAAACLAIWCNSAGAGYLQGTGRFGRLAVLQLAETAVRCGAALAAVAAGWGSRRGGRRHGRRRSRRHPGRARRRAPVDARSPAEASSPRARWATGTPSGATSRTVAPDRLRAGHPGAAVRTADRGRRPGHGRPGRRRRPHPVPALVVLARVPLHLATATAAVLFPRLAAHGPSAAGRTALQEALRAHWVSAGSLTAVLVTCPPDLLALLLPASYVSSAPLLLPLGIAGLAGATLTVTITAFRAGLPVRPAVLLLLAGCPGLACATVLTADRPAALAWSTAAVTGVVAVASVALTRRRVTGLGPAAGATAPLTAATAATLVLSALRPHMALWLPAACLCLLAAGLVGRPRRRRGGPYRIPHLGFEAPHSPGAGGAALRAHEVDRRLAARGIEVTVVCAPWPGCAETVRDGVRYRPLPPRLGPLARHRFLYQMAYFPAITLGLPRLLRRVDPDLVVEDFVPPFSSVCVPHLTRRPVVGVVQWLSAAEMTDRYRLPFHLVERRGLRSHTRLITVGPHLAAELRSRHPAADVTVLPNGLSPAAFVPPDAAEPRDHVVYLGRLETKSKGLDLLLRAYARAAPGLTTDLLIAGDCPDERAARALAAQLGIERRLRWLGRVDGDARFHLLARARLVCVPSRSETFGMVAAEALAAATPVLAFDLPCLRDW